MNESSIQTDRGAKGGVGEAPAVGASDANSAAAAQASTVLSTLEADGRRRWINPRPSFGRLWRWRRAVAYFLIGLFTLLPYLTIGGKPAILLDLGARRFTFFGKTFLPTDTLLMALLMVSLFVAIFLVTAIMGRVWCGWGCPQTVYMEFVYRPIERFFGGTPGRARSAFQQSALAMVLKYATFFVVSCFLAHTFLAYFIGVERLVQWVQMSPAKHPTPFLVMAVTTGLMLFDFVYFREQTCIVACPYGRFQSVLLDRQSKVITYDRRRGEPRGRAVKQGRDVGLAVLAGGAAAGPGDCVDCKLCVTTCPTGIDIRNGLQMECVNCAQCIDACDAVMTRLNRPTGLIRYASEAAMDGERPRLLRPRVVIYPSILLVLLTLFVVVLLRKGDTDVNVLRGMGAPFVTLADGMVGNQIKIKIVNRREKAATYHASARGADGLRVDSEMFPITLEPGEMKTAPALLVAPPAAFRDGTCVVEVIVSDGSTEVSRSAYRMMGPATGHHGGPIR